MRNFQLSFSKQKVVFNLLRFFRPMYFFYWLLIVVFLMFFSFGFIEFNFFTKETFLKILFSIYCDVVKDFRINRVLLLIRCSFVFIYSKCAVQCIKKYCYHSQKFLLCPMCSQFTRCQLSPLRNSIR